MRIVIIKKRKRKRERDSEAAEIGACWAGYLCHLLRHSCQRDNLLHASVHQRERDLLHQQESNLLHASAIIFFMPVQSTSSARESNQLHASVTYFISERDLLHQRDSNLLHFDNLLHQREIFTSSSAREIGLASTGHMTIGSQRTREY